MALPNIYSDLVQEKLFERVNILTEYAKPQWGKMNASQMLAHLNVMFELGLEQKNKRPNFFIRFMLQSFVKSKIISEVPYKKNSMTAPEMIIKHQPDFETEKNRMLEYMMLVGNNGSSFFEQREHPTFGKLSATEWNNLFYKHIDHHLKQFNI